MTYEEALRRVNAEVTYDPKDSSSRGLIPARILEVHHNKNKAKIVTAGTPKRDHIKWVPLSTLRCWKSRDEAAGIIDPPRRLPLAVVMAAESTADHMQNQTNSFTDRLAETFHDHGTEAVARSVDVCVAPAVQTPAESLIHNPGWCEWCDTTGHDPDSLDENGACPKCRELLLSTGRSSEIPMTAKSENAIPVSAPSDTATVESKNEPVRPLQLIRWVVLDLTNRKCYDPASRQFLSLEEVGGYMNSSNAHRSSGQLYRHTKNPFIFVVTRSQAEHLLSAQLPSPPVACDTPVFATDTFENVLKSVKQANEHVAAAKLAYDRAVETARVVSETAKAYQQKLEEQLRQLGV